MSAHSTHPRLGKENPARNPFGAFATPDQSGVKKVERRMPMPSAKKDVWDNPDFLDDSLFSDRDIEAFGEPSLEEALLNAMVGMSQDERNAVVKACERIEGMAEAVIPLVQKNPKLAKPFVDYFAELLRK